MATAQTSTRRASYSATEFLQSAINLGDYSLTFLIEELGRDVRLRTAQAFTHVRLLLPAHPEHVGDAKIGNLKLKYQNKQYLMTGRANLDMSSAIEK